MELTNYISWRSYQEWHGVHAFILSRKKQKLHISIIELKSPKAPSLLQFDINYTPIMWILHPP